MKENSEINFPPFTVKNGIMVLFSKIREQLKVYLLHPELGYRKLTANISKYLRNDAFVALTNTEFDSNLYLNADHLKKITKTELLSNLEVGDYVMVEVRDNELENIEIGRSVTALMLAKIKKLTGDKAQLEFFNVGPKTKVAELPLDRIKN